MWKNQIMLLICLIYVGDTLARSSFQPTSFDYDYRIQSRSAPRRHRGKSATTTPRPLIQQYWQNFVQRLPTLPPISWNNITSPIGNLFGSQAQEIIETPVSMHYVEEKPSRKRKSSKKSKNRKRKNSRNHYDSYSDQTQAQLRLEPLGLDHNRVMHFYEPTTGQYYSLQQEVHPAYYGYPYYSNVESSAKNEEYNDDSYEEEKTEYNPYDYNTQQKYVSNYGYHSNRGHHYNDQSDDQSEHNYNYEDNQQNSDNKNYETEKETNEEDDDDAQMQYDDDVQVVDNWGYTDEEIFADRKIKGSSNLAALKGSIVQVQKHLLKPETEDDVKLLLAPKGRNADKKERRNKKGKSKRRKLKKEKRTIESMRNALVSFMKDDSVNRSRQKANTKMITRRLVERPRRTNEQYYVFPADILL